jgi:hypothetical protein
MPLKSSHLAVVVVACTVLAAIAAFGLGAGEHSGPSAPANGVYIRPEPRLTQAERDEVFARMKADLDEQDARRAKVEAQFRCAEDRVTEVRVCKPKSAPKYTNSRSAVYAYYVETEHSLPKWWVFVGYAGGRWVFWDRLLIRNGESLETLGPFSPTRDMGGSTVAEYHDTNDPVSLVELSGLLSREGETIVRFVGDHTSDHTLKAWERQSFASLVDWTYPLPQRKWHEQQVIAERGPVQP